MPFRVWGVNYDHDSQGNGRLLEDYWETEWDTVQADFREIKELGANVVRIHLQLGKFLGAADQPNERALGQLRRLLDLAEETGLYLDITGLGCYHKTDTPAWYDSLPEAERWKVQATFWTAVARACRHSDMVFCYDLMNEPVIGGKSEEGWLGGELAGKYFVQRLTLDPGTRTSTEIARQWVAQMAAAVRAEDPVHMITVGVIPWAHVWPGAKPVFYSPEAGGPLDFVSIHLYPEKGGVEKALTALGTYEIGKPLLIEETFPLSCSIEEMDDFLTRSKDRTAGYVSFYWGQTADEAQAAGTSSGIVAKWLRFFAGKAAGMKAVTPQ
jgi:hypothetical protein